MEVRVLPGAKMKANLFFIFCLFLIIFLIISQQNQKEANEKIFKVLTYPSFFKNFYLTKIISENKKIYFLYLNNDYSLVPGDKIFIDDFVLKENKIFFPKKLEIISKNKIIEKVSFFKKFAKENIQKTLPWPEENILRGIIFGENLEDPELNFYFNKLGISHILVASGSNLVILTNIIFNSLKNFPLINLIFLNVIILFFLIFYLFLVGFEGSILRAFIFSLFLLIIKNFSGRIPLKRNILIFSLFLLVLISPEYLYDLGTILSFLSFTGLIYFSPIISQKLNLKNKILKEIIVSTFSSFIFTFPVISYYFGNLNFYSLFFNIFILPLIPLIFFLGIIFSSFPILILILFPLLFYLNQLSLLAKYLPTINLNLPLIFVIFYYLILIFLIYKLNRNENIDFNFSFS